MHKCVFTLGLILTSIYTVPAVAWPTKPATNIWTNSGHTTLANMRCDTCCKTNCWLPSGTYYDNVGTFSRSCSGEPSEPSCTPGATYSVVNGVCQGALSCPAGYCDVGYSSCLKKDYSSDVAYYNHWDREGYDGFTLSASDLEPGMWKARYATQNGTVAVTGVAACSEYIDSYGEAVDWDIDYEEVNGLNCWCKITGPFESLWAYYDYDFATIADCATECASDCAMELRAWYDNCK